MRPDVQAACEMLGYDVLQVANEGKMVAVVPAEQADAALAAMRAARYGEKRRDYRSRAAACRGHPSRRARTHRLGIDPHPRHARRRTASENLLGRNRTVGAMRLDIPGDVQIPATPDT